MSAENPKKAKFPAGEVANLESLVSYQPGSVVSRQIVTKKGGNVTVFAFDKGEGLSEHSAPFDALVQIIDGEAEIKLAGAPHKVVKGDVLLMPANIPHALHAVTSFKMVLTMIKSD